MILKKGITGFFDLNDDFQPPSVDFTSVKSLSYQIYAAVSFSVLNISKIEISNNFY